MGKTIKDIIIEWIKNNNCDGLVNLDTDCSCSIENFDDWCCMNCLTWSCNVGVKKDCSSCNKFDMNTNTCSEGYYYCIIPKDDIKEV